MKTGEKTYFDLDVVQIGGHVGVLMSDILQLQCADKFTHWIRGAQVGLGDDGEQIIYLNDWKRFACQYLDRQSSLWLKTNTQFAQNWVFFHQKNKEKIKKR